MCNKQHVLTATIYDKRGRVLSMGKNSYIKTHRIQASYAKSVGLDDKIYLHAEINAILKCREIDKAYRIFVSRFHKNGKPANAKPCPICIAAIKDMTNIKIIEHT